MADVSMASVESIHFKFQWGLSFSARSLEAFRPIMPGAVPGTNLRDIG